MEHRFLRHIFVTIVTMTHVGTISCLMNLFDILKQLVTLQYITSFKMAFYVMFYYRVIPQSHIGLWIWEYICYNNSVIDQILAERMHEFM